MSDVSIALRSLLKQPRFPVVAVLTMALGIGACSALYSIYDRLVLHPTTISSPSNARRDPQQQPPGRHAGSVDRVAAVPVREIARSRSRRSA